MKFTKGLFVGTALGISAAMMMNNKSKISNVGSSNTANNTSTANANASMANTNANTTYANANNNNLTGTTAQTEEQTNNYMENDII